MSVKRYTIFILAGLLLLLFAQAVPALAETPPDTATVGSHLAAFGIEGSVDPSIAAYTYKFSDLLISSYADTATDPETAARRYPWKAQCATCHGAYSPSPDPAL